MATMAFLYPMRRPSRRYRTSQQGELRYQPEGELTKWHEDRFGHGSRRIQRIGIVALARKLLIELWRYLETGAIPEGAAPRTGPAREEEMRRSSL